MEAEADDEELWSGPYKTTMFSEEHTADEMYSIDPFGLRAAAEQEREDSGIGMKRKVWMEEADGNKSKFTKREKEESSGTGGRRLN